MDDLNTLAPEPAATPQPPRKPRRAGLYLVLAALAAAAAGGLVTSALGQEIGRWWGGGWGMHGWGMPMGMHGMDDPAAMSQHVERMVRHLAVEVDATPEQESRLAAIAKAAADDLMPLRQQARDARRQAVQLLAAPTIDRAAIEQFRTSQLAIADTASKRLAQALADAAEVLTPDQRQQLAERLARLQEHRRGWRWHGEGLPDQPDRPE